MTDPRKAWATLQAELLLVGWHAVLTDGDDGRRLLVCSRWAMTRIFDDLTRAQRWAEQVLGQRGRALGAAASTEAADGHRTIERMAASIKADGG